jgi:23S rRNA-/tRNA-specific pseudouridylate synthase
MREHPWSLDCPNLDTALNQQLQAEKPELLRLGATCFGSIYILDPEFSGVALFGLHRPAIATQREIYGDGKIESRIEFLARDQPDQETLASDAPLLPHNTKPKMIPSTAKGKRSTSEFKRLAVNDSGWALWEARLKFARPHQVRAHAALVGIPILGDTCYGGPHSPTMRDLDPRRRGTSAEAPLFKGLAGHLRELRLPGSIPPILAPRPRRFETALLRLGLNATAT